MTVDSSNFAGIPFQQTWRDLPLWETLLSTRPIKAIAELGTGQGGMAVFFAMQAAARGMKFATFDRQRLFGDDALRMLERLGATYHEVDIFGRADYVRGVLAALPRPLALFCDNGDKPREFETFLPELRSGDVIAVHDWNAEIGPQHVPAAIMMILRDECEKTEHGMTRFFLKP